MKIDCGELKLVCKNFEPLFGKSGMSHHLSNIRLSYLPDKKVLILVSTNGSIFNNSLMKVEPEAGEQKFDVLVDGSKFCGSVGTMYSASIYITYKDNMVLVKDKETKSKFKLQTMATDVFPSPVMKKDSLSQYQIDAKELLKITSCIVDVAQDSAKSENVKQFGVFMEFKSGGLTVYNISGMRSFIISPESETGSLDDNISCFDSKEFRYLKQVVKSKVVTQDDNTKVVISIDKGTGIVSFKFSDCVIYLRKLALRLPSIHNVVSKARECELTLEKASLCDLMKKASLMENFDAGMFTFLFVKGEDLIIRVATRHDSDVHLFDGEMIIEQLNDDGAFFKFNSTVFFESLQAINDTKLIVKMPSKDQILNGMSNYGWIVTGESNKSVTLVFSIMGI